MWTAMFNEVGTKLLYSMAYDPQTDGQSERTNQTIEIVLRYYLHALYDPDEPTDPYDWVEVLPRLQFHLNN